METYSEESEDVRTRRPSTRQEIAVLQEALAPTRRAYVKLSGHLTPTALLSESYSVQHAVIQKAFEQMWTQSYKDVVPPKLPSLQPWEGGILGLLSYNEGHRGMTMIRYFDVTSRKWVEATIERHRERNEGPFCEPGNQVLPVRAVSRRVQRANAHYLNKRGDFFSHRPSLTNATEAQKWCLNRLHQSWKKRIRNSAPMVAYMGSKSAQKPCGEIDACIEKVRRRRPDKFYTWLRSTGVRVWEAHWQHMTEEEYGQLIAPIVFATSRSDIPAAVPERSDPVKKPQAERSTSIRAHHCNLDRAAAMRSEAIRGKDLFIGAEEYMAMTGGHDKLAEIGASIHRSHA